MIYLIYGNDWKRVRQKTTELIEALQRKKPDASLLSLDSENFTDSYLDEYLGSQGLFERKSIVFLDGVLKNSESKKIIKRYVSEMKESENIFIFLENDLDKDTEKTLSLNAEKVQKYESNDKKDKKTFEIFAISDALGERDKKKLWTLLVSALAKNSSPEEINGILFWQVKNILLAKHSADAKEAGLSPFVFAKAKKYSKNFSEEEIVGLSNKLVSLFHESHRGTVDFEVGLERFVLEI